MGYSLSREDMDKASWIACEVSRSFASVIRELPAGLSLDVLIFYLVLRGLDTVEDDMEAFKGAGPPPHAPLRGHTPRVSGRHRPFGTSIAWARAS